MRESDQTFACVVLYLRDEFLAFHVPMGDIRQQRMSDTVQDYRTVALEQEVVALDC